MSSQHRECPSDTGCRNQARSGTFYRNCTARVARCDPATATPPCLRRTANRDVTRLRHIVAGESIAVDSCWGC